MFDVNGGIVSGPSILVDTPAVEEEPSLQEEGLDLEGAGTVVVDDQRLRGRAGPGLGVREVRDE